MTLSRYVRLIPFALLAGFAAAGAARADAGAETLTRVGQLPAGARPAGVPADYVVTPHGYFHASCVVQVAEGEQVAATGDVLTASGARRAVPACAFPSFGTRGGASASAVRRPAAVFNGWVADSNSNPAVTPPAGGMQADWVVPAGPARNSGQTLYFFPGLEASPGVITILQPVLAWNGYSNFTWTMANWNCCVDGTIYTGKPIPVSSGDQIRGRMVGVPGVPGQPAKTWKITSIDVTTQTQTTFSTGAFNQAFNWYFGGAMEVYGVSRCDEFPASGRIDFQHVQVVDVNRKPVVVNAWNTGTAATAPDCGYAVKATAHDTLITFDPTAP